MNIAKKIMEERMMHVEDNIYPGWIKDTVKEREFMKILKNKSINTFFQPIVSLRTGKVMGYEALSRITKDSPFSDIEEFINYATLIGRLPEAEELMLNTALRRARESQFDPYSKLLFLNIDPNVLCAEGFLKKFEDNKNVFFNNIDLNIVFELTERREVLEGIKFYETIDYLKRKFFRLAIDDMGQGYNKPDIISDVNPHFVKLSMKLVRNVHKDKLKAALIKGMVEVSKATDIKLIAEGIETEEELSTLIEMGVQYAQGFLIQHPCDKFHEIDDNIMHFIKSSNSKKNAINNYTIANTYIKHLSKKVDTIDPDESISDISNYFMANPEAFGFCITKKDIPVGIITTENFNSKVGGQYGFSLYSKKPISRIMDRDFLRVDYKQSVNEVSIAAMERNNDKLYDFVVVTKNEKFYGVVTIKDLLIKSTELEISSARHQSPLTGLPGNLIIEQQIAYAIGNCDEYTVCYIDIDNFKAFNDVYGFEAGDHIIQLLAQLLSTEYYGHFVGHIGGDDFVVVLNEQMEEEDFGLVIRKFEEAAKGHYSEADRERGYIVSENRKGEIDSFPLMSITCASLNSRNNKTHNSDKLTQLLAERKSVIKKQKRKLAAEKNYNVV